MAQLCDAVLKGARRQFDDGFQVEELPGGACRLTTPLLRHDNDAISVLVVDGGGGRLLVTDGGASVDYLRMSGFTTRRNRPFQHVLRDLPQTFQVQVTGDELYVECTEAELSDAVIAVSRAAQHISYMVHRRRERLVTSFNDKVELDLIQIGAQYEPEIDIQGATKSHRFSFFVNGGHHSIVQPLSATSRTAAEKKAAEYLFYVLDVREGDGLFRFVTVVDDQNVRAGIEIWNSETIGSLERYSDAVVHWSEDHTERLRQALETAAAR